MLSNCSPSVIVQLNIGKSYSVTLSDVSPNFLLLLALVFSRFGAVQNTECLPGFRPTGLIGSPAIWEPTFMVGKAAALGSSLYTLRVTHVPCLLIPLTRNEQKLSIGEATAERSPFTVLHFLHFSNSTSQLIVLELSKMLHYRSSPYKLLVFKKMLYIIMILFPREEKVCIKQKL